MYSPIMVSLKKKLKTISYKTRKNIFTGQKLIVLDFMSSLAFR